jgi:hypothetical protein
MSKRTRTVAGLARRKAARFNDRECTVADRRPDPGFARSEFMVAPAGDLTRGITSAAQDPTSPSSPPDEDLHSVHATPLDAPPRPHRHGAAPLAGQPWQPMGRLPLPVLLEPTSRPDLFCTVTPIDDRGRLADRSPIRAAGWAPGQPVSITPTDSRELIVVQPGGPQTITTHGHLRLPASVRLVCDLSAGDRLLVTVTATPPLLAVYPMATVEAILRQHS